MRLSIRRTLVQALIVSVLIHAVLLLGVTVLPPASEGTTAKAINVVMKREEPRIEPVQPASEPVRKMPASPVKPSVAPRRKVPEQTIIVADQATDSPVLSVPASPVTQEVVSSVPAASVAVANGSTARPVGPANASDSISADEMAEFRLSLGKAARRFKNYPRLARERGWEGTVEVALIFNARSPVPDVTLTRSSGREILDEQAQEMALRAARATVLPSGLKGRDFKVPLPVKFSLEDE